MDGAVASAIAAVAFVVALIVTEIARRTALRFDVVDSPGPRKVHRAPTPMLGGTAVFAGVAVAVLVFAGDVDPGSLGAIVLAGSLMLLWGLWDDVRELGVLSKLAAQAVGATVVVATGVRVQLTGSPVWDALLSWAWIVGVTNAVNLLDHHDGVAAGVAAIASGFLASMAVTSGQASVAGAAAALGGACTAFVVFNFPPARIFLGDAGSLFIGLVVASLAVEVRFLDTTPAITWMVPVILLAVPIFDTALVIVSRWRRGLNPFLTPGTDHVSHRIARSGWTPRQVALMVYGAAVVAGVVSRVVAATHQRWTAYAIGALVLVFGLGLGAWLEIGNGSGEGGEA